MKPTYETSECKLYFGRNEEVVPRLIDINAVISDPPYGMANNTDSTRYSGTSTTGRSLLRGEGINNWPEVIDDEKPFDPSPWIDFDKVVLWGVNHFAQRLEIGTTLVWIKKAPNLFGTFQSDAEVAWMKGGHGVYCFFEHACPLNKMKEFDGTCLHPNQKPINLMKWCLDKAKVQKGEWVLDPYMGSGTTGVACLQTGRKFIGIEADPTYFATALKRLKDQSGAGVVGEMSKQIKRLQQRRKK